MLTIRMQRTGRKGYATFRVIVQDSRFSPTSGRVVARIGHYNPHTKEAVIDKEKAQEYMKNGAQPSPRVIRLLQSKKIAMPDWVEVSTNDTKRSTRNPEKLRKNQPKVEKPKAEEPVAEESTEEPVADEQPAVEEPAEESKTEEPAETPAETDANSESEQTTEDANDKEAEDSEKPEEAEVDAAAEEKEESTETESAEADAEAKPEEIPAES